MAVLNFPADTSQSPYVENGITYEWDGQAWVSTGGTDQYVPTTGGTITGDLTVEGDTTVSGDVTVGSLNGGQLAGLRNQLINGDFQIWQRAITGTTTAAVDYVTADRWRIGKEGVTVQSTRINSPFGYAVQVNNTSQFQQRVELLDAGNQSQFETGTVWTLSFWVNGVTKEQVGASMFFGTTNTNFQAGFTGTDIIEVDSKSGWTKLSRTFTIDQAIRSTDIWCAIAMDFAAAGSLAYVQLEPGPVATPFEDRPVALELVMCQRYYCTQVTSIRFYMAANQAYEEFARWPVRMYTTPTVIGPTGGVLHNVAAHETAQPNADGTRVIVTCGAVTGDAYAVNSVLRASAEL